MLTCTLQAHDIAHETTPYCPTIPNHRLNGTVYVRQAGVIPVPPLATLWQGKLRPNTDLTFHICAPHNARPPSQFAARQMVASPRRFFINIQPNV